MEIYKGYVAILVVGAVLLMLGKPWEHLFLVILGAGMMWLDFHAYQDNPQSHGIGGWFVFGIGLTVTGAIRFIEDVIHSIRVEIEQWRQGRHS